MQRITPCLWFDENAEEAVDFYSTLFKNSKKLTVSQYGEAGAAVSGRPKGSTMTVAFQLAGQEFLALNGGPIFKFTPAISLFVACESEKEVDALYEQLSKSGQVLMPLDEYPFSKKFAWVQDRFGLSWQLILAPRSQKITPALMFVNEQHGKAEEAMKFYTSQFKNSKVGDIHRYQAGEPGQEGTVKHAVFTIDGQDFVAMDSNIPHAFKVTPATSFIVNCKSQEEVDDFWKNLSAGGKMGHCGWLEDKYGVSWQIVPVAFTEMMKDTNPEKSERVFGSLMQMSKIDLATLQRAYDQ